MLRDVKGFEGEYMVSDCGELYSVKNGSPVLLKGGSNGKYRSFSLRKDGVQYQRSLHRLVAEAFIENPENKPEVNHIDGDKLNNAVENLEWSTRSENAKHAYDNGMIKISNEHLSKMRQNIGRSIALFTETDAQNIRAIYRTMAKPSCRKIAKAYDCSKNTIQRIVNGTQQNFREVA